MSDRKADATGRSTDKLTGVGRKATKYRRPPKGIPWTWLTGELVNSPAWMAMGVNTRRLIDRLLIEHMDHAGTENGELPVTYDNFVEYGIHRDAIRGAIEEAGFLGLVRVTERGGKYGEKKIPSKYRLTWMGDKHGAPWTNEWKGVTQEQIDNWKDQRKEIRWLKQERKNKFSSPETRTGLVPLSVLDGGKSRRGRK